MGLFRWYSSRKFPHVTSQNLLFSKLCFRPLVCFLLPNHDEQYEVLQHVSDIKKFKITNIYLLHRPSRYLMSIRSTYWAWVQTVYLYSSNRFILVAKLASALKCQNNYCCQAFWIRWSRITRNCCNSSRTFLDLHIFSFTCKTNFYIILISKILFTYVFL